MECPYCGAELEQEDSYGSRTFVCNGDQSGKLGDIYRCPNAEGFSTLEEVLTYIDGGEDELEEYCNQHGIEGWDEVVCDSAALSPSGSFYTDKSGDLHEGYPC